MEKYVLAIDHGTSGIKTSIISMHGDVVAFEFEKTPIHFFPGAAPNRTRMTGGMRLLRRPSEWWRAKWFQRRRLTRSAFPALFPALWPLIATGIIS